MSETRQHQPGDVVNGHRLSEDGTTWEPVVGTEPVPPAKKKHTGLKVAGAVVGAVLVVGVIGAIAGGGSKSGSDAAASTTPSAPAASTPTPSDTPTEAPKPTPTVSAAAPKPTPTKPAPPAPTASQEQALGAAQDYLDTQAFSRLGLIQQLSSQYGSGFSKADAIWAVDHVGADWNTQAVKAAHEYLDTQHFSCSGLIQQLDSSYGSQFTKAQATYAAKHVGLC